MTFAVNIFDLQTATQPSLETIAQFSALRIVESLAGGTGIGIFAVALLWLARRQNAATKYAIGFSALAAIALLPFVSLFCVRAGSPGTLKAAVTVSDSWAVYLFATWAMVASWFLIGVVRSFLRLRALRKSCTPITVSALDPVLQETCQRSQIKRRVVICTSEDVRVPTALGLINPAIVIPQWAWEELSTDELKQILLHELAHLRRWDDWTNLAQQLVKAFFFFHPAVWWIESKAALEREIACDDAVLEATGSARAYAECLAHLAERSFLQRSLALAQAAIGKLQQTSSRVAQILDGNRRKGSARAWKVAVSSVAGFAVACAVGVSRAPKLIAFESGQQRIAESLRLHEVHQRQSSREIIPALTIPAGVNADEVSPGMRIVRVKFNTDPTPHRSFKKAPTILKPKAGRMMHLASVEAVSAPRIESVLILIQSLGSDSSGQIQMWHLTVVRFVQEPVSSTTPPRKT